MKQTPSAFNPGASAPEERVRRVVVPLVTPDEMPRWIDLMSRHHYLSPPDLFGEVLGYVATVDHEWAALLGWDSAALHVTARDRWIGWSDDQRHRRFRKFISRRGPLSGILHLDFDESLAPAPL